MKFCKNCSKETPTKVIGKKEECMVCGTIIQEYEIPKGQKIKDKDLINRKLIEDVKNITKTNRDTGKYENAQKVGQNVLIGLLILVAGILYSIGGLDLLLTGGVVLVGGLIVLAVIIFLIAMASD